MRVLRHINDLSPRARPGVKSPRDPDQHPEDWLTVPEAIVQALRISATHATAAGYAGIAPSTLSVWVKRGLDHIEVMRTDGLDEPAESEALYVQLALDVIAEDAGAQVSVIADVRRAVPKEWRAGAWLLEKRYGGPWASPNRSEVTVTGGGVGSLLGEVPSHEEMDTLEADLRRRQREIDAGQPLEVTEVSGAA